MEVYQAKFNYDKQRKDVMSFRKGDQFYVIDKPNDEWWKARKIDDSTFGYVPAIYLEKCHERTVGKLIPEGRKNTREHDIHLQALAELHRRVKPLPAHVIGHALGMDVPKEPPPSSVQISVTGTQQPKSPPPPVSSPPPPDYDLDDSDEKASNQVPYHHRLNDSGRFIDLGNLDDNGSDDGPPTQAPTAPPQLSEEWVDEEGSFIVPSPLPNPVLESTVHRDLHRELRTSGRKVLNQSNELKKVFRDRSQRQTKKALEEERILKRTSFDIKLQERLKLEDQESITALEVLEQAAREPEFMKVQLKPRGGSGSRKT